MQYKKAEKPLEFQLDIDPEVPKYLFGDKLRLNQILYNIVGNAVKFTDAGFIKISIRMEKQEGNQLTLSFIVQDSGIGIPQEKIDTIFESFTRIRTKERIFEGTGLEGFLQQANHVGVQQLRSKCRSSKAHRPFN
jgi:signal transduction histidine kinase